MPFKIFKLRMFDKSFKLIWEFDSHKDKVLSLSIRDDYLLSGSKDLSILIHDLVKKETDLIGKHEGKVNDVAWSKNGKYVASAGADRRIIVWERRNELINEIRTSRKMS